MTLMKENNKTTLTFRLSDDLKAELATEAEEKKMTASAYVEHLIMSRQQGNEGQVLLMQSLREQIIELELENEKLRCAQDSTPQNGDTQADSLHIRELTDKMAVLITENKSLRAQQFENQEHLKTVIKERDTLIKLKGGSYPHWFSEEGYKQFISQIKKLLSIHPDKSAEQIVLSSMSVTLENETNSFFVNRLSGFWKQNPHYLTTSKQ